MRIAFGIIMMILLATPIEAQQNIEGVITFNRKQNYISIMSKLPHITQEDVDRMSLTWGKMGDGTNYELYLQNNKSVYLRKEEQSESGYSWKKDQFLLIRDYKGKSQEDLIETLGKVYHIKEDLPRTKWKILNEIKEIAGYLCMKAETKNTIKGQTIHAWFTDAIPMSGGPEGYGGLPGMILEIDINNQDAVITATKVVLDQDEVKIPYPKKIKGKKIDRVTYNDMVKKYIDETIEGKKNPYWRVRY
jgi:GLPGLI family protein